MKGDEQLSGRLLIIYIYITVDKDGCGKRNTEPVIKEKQKNFYAITLN